MDYIASALLNALQSLPAASAIRVIDTAARSAKTPETFDAAISAGIRLEEIAGGAE